MNSGAVGVTGERLAAKYLERKGYEILERGYRPRHGEIDIVARDGKTTVFVEVKTRTGERHGTPEESVGAGKVRRLLRAVGQYVSAEAIDDYRVDVVAILLNRETGTAHVRHYLHAVGEEGRV